MAAKAIVCDSSVIRGMSNDPRNICYHYRHHLTGKQVYHCEISYPEVVEGLIRDLRMLRERAEAFFARWEGEFNSERLPLTTKGKTAETQIQRRLAVLKGFIPSKTLSGSSTDIRIAGETIARGIPELASHDRDFLFIEVVCKNELDVILLEMLPDGSPRRKHLSSQHEHRLVNRLETSGIELEVSVAAG